MLLLLYTDTQKWDEIFPMCGRHTVVRQRRLRLFAYNAKFPDSKSNIVKAVLLSCSLQCPWRWRGSTRCWLEKILRSSDLYDTQLPQPSTYTLIFLEKVYTTAVEVSLMMMMMMMMMMMVVMIIVMTMDGVILSWLKYCNTIQYRLEFDRVTARSTIQAAAVWWMLYEVKAGVVYSCSLKTVWSMPERFRGGELLTMGRYTNPASFLWYVLTSTVYNCVYSTWYSAWSSL